MHYYTWTFAVSNAKTSRDNAVFQRFGGQRVFLSRLGTGRIFFKKSLKSGDDFWYYYYIISSAGWLSERYKQTQHKMLFREAAT